MRGEYGVDQGRFAESRLTWTNLHDGVSNRKSAVRTLGRAERNRLLTDANDVELKATLQELSLNLRGDAVETDMGLGIDGARLSRGRRSGCSHCSR